MRITLKWLVVAFLIALMPLMSHAELTIEISGGGAQRIPVAIVPFGLAGASVNANTSLAAQEKISQIIGADLNRSGLFRVLETRGVNNQPVDVAQIKYAEWSAIQTQALTVGNVETLAGGRLKISFHLMDVFKQNQLTGMEYNIAPNQLRATAHKIADAIYQKMTGEAGIFASRIAYITKNNKRYALQVADTDGFNPQTVVSSNEPIISPAWSPDGNKIAYVSFEKKKPIIFVQSLVSGSRTIVANFKGNNSAPSWSPDGSKLAIVLTYGENSQIYTINADGTGLQSLTKSSGIDTEPTWSPDGKWIYFTSDRGGRPQIYKVSTIGGEASRVTFEGAYNVSPRISPDGKSLAYISNDSGRFRVALKDLISGQVQVLSEGGQDESPSFAPNGRVILYATRLGSRGALAAVSSDGKIRQRLSDTGGDVREPAWGPLTN